MSAMGVVICPQCEGSGRWLGEICPVCEGMGRGCKEKLDANLEIVNKECEDWAKFVEENSPKSNRKWQ